MAARLGEYWVEILLFLALIFLSSWEIPARPATWFDEGINIGIAKALVEHGVFSLPIAPEIFVEERPFLITTNYPVLLPVALSFQIFGFTLTAARVPMIFFLIGFAAVAYILARRSYGQEAARFSLALLVSFIPLYGNGLAVLGEVPGLFFLMSGLLMVQSGFAMWRLFLAGFLFGLSVATKPFFLILIPTLVIGEWMMYRRTGLFARRLAVLLAGGALPFMLWLYTILPTLSFSAIADTFSFYANSYASSNMFELVGRNLVRFMTESTPIHFLILALGAAFFFWRRSRMGELFYAEVILGVFVVLTMFFYLKTPGWYRYFFPAHLILFLFFPVGLAHLSGRKSAFAAVTVLFLVQSFHLFLVWNTSLYYSRAAEELAGKIMQETVPGESLLLVNKPSVAFFLRDREVYQYLEINPMLHFGSRRPIGSDGKTVIRMYD